MRPFSFKEPAEDEPGEQANQGSGMAFLVVRLGIVRKVHLRKCPEVPVRQFAVESLIEQLDVEDLLPGGVEGVEVVDREPLRMDEVRQRE